VLVLPHANPVLRVCTYLLLPPACVRADDPCSTLENPVFLALPLYLLLAFCRFLLPLQVAPPRTAPRGNCESLIFSLGIRTPLLFLEPLSYYLGPESGCIPALQP